MASKKVDGAALTLKDLKSKLDDNELDLSMHELTVVPVKAMAQLPKATHVDLSTNRLEVLPLDFATSLTHLVKLDLSQNRLVHLPDNFGELRSLAHLDLYRNQLEELPLSFANLRHLKWLDLKDNPLEPALAKAAGDCLDEKQCKTAASRVVAYVQKIQSDHERERQKRLDHERETTTKKQAKEQAEQKEKSAAKKREKENRKQQNTNGKRDAEATHDAATTKASSPKKQNAKERGAHANKKDRPKRSCLGWMCSWLLTLMMMALGVAFLAAFGVYHNCSSREKWLPQSAGLCADLNTLTASGNLPKTAQQNVIKAAEGAKLLLRKKSDEFVHYLQATDYATVALDGWNWICTQTIAAAQWTQKTAIDT
uniref:Leucine rich repeat containing 59 n=1 Tax=Plectus sambesii TaxID=2011161 RepID=A0A914WJ09_9BILA